MTIHPNAVFRMLMLLPAIAGMSCRKLISLPATTQEVTAAAVFDNDVDAQAAFAGLYAQMMNGAVPYNGQISLFTGLSSDELACTVGYLPQNSFYHDSLTATNPLCVGLYINSYNLIYIINSAIRNIQASTGMSAAIKSQLTGEAEFDRAFIYFYLVNLFGDVPLVTSPLYTVSSVVPRTPVAKVYVQIESDLEDAQSRMSDTYITAYGYANDRTRPVRAAATALLARVLLFEGRWEQAETAANAVIGDGRFQLESALGQVFLATSREAIWQLQPVGGTMATADAGFFIPPGDGFQPQYVLTPALLDAFEPGDLRRSMWTRGVTVGGQSFVYPFKYRQRVATASTPEYEMVFRLAEQYLVRAEARAQQGKLTDAAADLDSIRVRAGLTPVVITDQAALLSAIMHERQVELATEWGHRWLDLKRTGRVDAVLSAKPGWMATDALYPLPAQDLKANPALTQNPGYD